MLNLKSDKETSTSKEKNNNIKRKEDLSLINLFNYNYKIPKSLKGDKLSINFQDFEKRINLSVKNHNLLLYQKLKKKSSKINLGKVNTNNYPSIFIYNNNYELNHSTESSNKEVINSFCIDNKKMLLQKRFDEGNIALNSNQIINVKDINNPYIYSYIDWHPYSFCTGHRKWGYENGKLKSPSPVFIDNDEWCKSKDLSKGEVLKGILIRDDVGLLLVDPFVCKKFSGMLGDLIKQILKVVFGHKISLNVKLFQPLSLSQTLLNYF